MGRKQNLYPPFVMMERPTLESAEWKQLSHSEMISYLYIKKNFNGRNNGKIPMKYLETKDIFAPATFAVFLIFMMENFSNDVTFQILFLKFGY